MTESTQQASGGIGFCGILAIVFIVLKLVGTINWSWWWVLAPIWIPWVIALAIVGIVFLIYFIAYLVTN